MRWHNPTFIIRTGHAKFHNAQTMLLDTCLGLTALGILWLLNTEEKIKIRLAILLSSFYWITQVGAARFLGTPLTDLEFAYPDEPPHQLIVDLVMLALLTMASLLEWRRLKTA